MPADPGDGDLDGEHAGVAASDKRSGAIRDDPQVGLQAAQAACDRAGTPAIALLIHHALEYNRAAQLAPQLVQHAQDGHRRGDPALAIAAAPAIKPAIAHIP